MPIGVQTKLFINNQWVNSVSGKTFKVVNPSTEEVITEMQEADAADVDIAVSAARKAFDEGPWKDYSGAQRRDLLLKLADLIEKNADELAEYEALNNGKPKTIARDSDVALTVAVYRYYAGWADKVQGKTIPTDGKFFAYTRHEPVGVVGQIIPWNFPVYMQSWKLAPALAAGCTIVMKSSEKTPITALMVAKLIEEAGFPAGVVNMLSGYGPTAGAAIARHMQVDKVAFTGSSKVGRLIMEMAAKSNLKRVSLELGGKSPLIICRDADVSQAVEIAQNGLFFNNGQNCCASSRIFVHEDIYDKFIAECAASASKQVVGDPLDPASQQGPVVDQIQFDRVLKYIDIGKSEGAKLLCGGSRKGTKGYFIEPTVFADVKDEMRIAKEEIFGPVMSVIKFSSIEEAIRRANATPYGLAAGVVCRDATQMLGIVNKLRAGAIYVNCYNIDHPAVPFGGFKESGMGRELGEYGLNDYCEIKSVFIPLP